jgi:assimilatory nitrate reductase catalytic subunit
MHWTGETAPSARIDTLVAAMTDPVSGQPESKASVVAVCRFAAGWYGFAVSRDPMNLTSEYWALARTRMGHRAELAGHSAPSDWEEEARRLFAAPSATATTLIDASRGSARVVLQEGGLVIGALFISAEPVALMRDHLVNLPGTEAEDVLTGQPPKDRPNPGPVLCSCFGIGIHTIVTAIETEGLMSVEQIGEMLGAGTNCGSCRPELAELLLRVQTKEAAE